MKKKYLYFWLLAILLPSFGFAQSKCDTIITTDDQIIIADIIKNDNTGILYLKCGTDEDHQYFLPSKSVKELRRKGESRKSVKPSPASKSSPVIKQHNSRFRAPSSQGRPKVIAWLGLSFLGNNLESSGPNYHFGAEVGFKNNPSVRLAAVIRPISIHGYYYDYQKEGVSGELGLTCKKFTIGRLSGFISKAYWGGEIRFGKLDYSSSYSTNGVRSSIKSSWEQFMICGGFQFSYKMVALDLSLPVGIGRYQYSNQGSYSYAESALTLQPSISVGLRF